MAKGAKCFLLLAALALVLPTGLDFLQPEKVSAPLKRSRIGSKNSRAFGHSAASSFPTGEMHEFPVRLLTTLQAGSWRKGLKVNFSEHVEYLGYLRPTMCPRQLQPPVQSCTVCRWAYAHAGGCVGVYACMCLCAGLLAIALIVMPVQSVSAEDCFWGNQAGEGAFAGSLSGFGVTTGAMLTAAALTNPITTAALATGVAWGTFLGGMNGYFDGQATPSCNEAAKAGSDAGWAAAAVGTGVGQIAAGKVVPAR